MAVRQIALVHRRVGGSIWHLVKGVKNSPSGSRLFGGLQVLIHSQLMCCLTCKSAPRIPPGAVAVCPLSALHPTQPIYTVGHARLYGWSLFRRDAHHHASRRVIALPG